MVRKFERRLEPLMTEDGEIDGKLLRTAIQIWKPTLADAVPLPEGNFRLSSFVDDMFDIVMGRRR